MDRRKRKRQARLRSYTSDQRAKEKFADLPVRYCPKGHRLGRWADKDAPKEIICVKCSKIWTKKVKAEKGEQSPTDQRA